MDLITGILDWVQPLLPMSATVVAVLLVIYAARFVTSRRSASSQGIRFRLQVITLVLSLVGLLVVVLALPVSETTRGQLLSLIGIVLSAAIALSSTTFVGNAMAGFMLRAVRSFRIGDFIRIDDHFGRVSEQGLFHTEIQTEDRDLTTLPNLHLVTHPYKVVRSSGTMITAEVSLGYDIPSKRITDALIRAAEAAGLVEPFVHIMSLDDFSVVYRVSGLLTEVRQVLSSRSRLREEVLASLHADGIEIVSPTFMNTRAYPPDSRFIAEPGAGPNVQTQAPEIRTTPEDVVFDKAEEAESLEALRIRCTEIRESIKSTKKEKDDQPETAQAAWVDKIERLENQLLQLEAEVSKRESEIEQ